MFVTQDASLLEMFDFAVLDSLKLLLLFVTQDASLFDMYDFAVLDSLGLLLLFALLALD